jgi:hypothetical protein
MRSPISRRICQTLIRPMSKVVVRPSMGPKTGVDAMFSAAHWFESTVGLEVALIGRDADDLTNDAVLELTGRWLSYRIA